MIRKIMAAATAAIFVLQFSGCGTILHPERKGQKGGSIDAGIAILDGIGLLFFLLPGVIAFAVDFSNGTIYLPPERSRVPPTAWNLQSLRQIKFDPRHCGTVCVERLVNRETGQHIRLDQSGMKITRLDSSDQVAQLISQSQPRRLALSQ